MWVRAYLGRSDLASAKRFVGKSSAFGAFAVLRGGHAILDERVPLVAVRALPEQLVAAVAAADADVGIAVEDSRAAHVHVAIHVGAGQLQCGERFPDALVQA